ncbi:MAG: phage tail assembly chaperone, partial [Chloroflexota bacterium]
SSPDLMRAIRDRLLELTDWTQVSDSPLTATARAAWATYRQALRDLPHAELTRLSDAQIRAHLAGEAGA